MADADKPTSETETKPAPKPVTAAPARKAIVLEPVFVDYRGPMEQSQESTPTNDLAPAVARRRARAAARAGARVPPHKLAPLVASKAGKKLVLRPGLNVVPADVWKAHAPARSSARPGPGLDLRLAAGELVVLDALPAKAEAICELCERTQCPEALAALRQHEWTRRGGKDGEHAREGVMAALDERIATVKRRATDPQASGPRLEPKAVERRFRRLRAS